MSFFSYALGACDPHSGAVAPGQGPAGAAGVPTPSPGGHRGHRPLRDVVVRGRSPRLVLRLALGGGDPRRRRLGLGILRGLSMRVWSTDNWVLRQGNAVTMALWLVSLLVHFVGDTGQSHAGAAGLEGASFLLYLGVTLCRAVLRGLPPGPAALGETRARRRTPVRGAVHAGPGCLLRHLHRTGWCRAGWLGAGPGTSRSRQSSAPYADDPNIIDAEVVEDDDDHGPPELHAPR